MSSNARKHAVYVTVITLLSETGKVVLLHNICMYTAKTNESELLFTSEV